MTSSQSRIWTELDFEKEGKQIGALMVDHSVTRSAYGMIPAPATVIRNGEGPTVVMLAGNHGDEFESQIVLSELIREFDPHDLNPITPSVLTRDSPDGSSQFPTMVAQWASERDSGPELSR